MRADRSAARAIAALVLLLATSGLALGQERVAVRGSALRAPAAVADLLDPYRKSPDSATVARILERQVGAATFPRLPEDGILEARLWRLADRPRLALAVLDSITAPRVQPLRNLERARVLLGSGGDLEGGARAWWAACKNIDGPTRVEITADILPLTTADERAEWGELGSDKQACDWLRDFWTDRAQRMAISVDERLALHYRRLAHARDWYWIPRPYFLLRPADFHSRPDSLAVDDRGLVFIRMGAPLTEGAFRSNAAGEPGGGLSPTSGQDEGTLAPATTARCWPYWRPGGYRIYCFDEDHRLTDNVWIHPGTRFFHQYVANSNLPRTHVRNLIMRSGRVSFSGLREPWERALDRAEDMGWGLHGQTRTRENLDEALEEIPDVPDVRATVRFHAETLRFLNPGSGRWQIWTLASIRAGDLTASADSLGGHLAAGGRYSVPGPEGVTIGRFSANVVAADSVGDDTGLPLRGVIEAAPGALPLTVVVEDLNSPGTGAWLQDTINVPAVGGLPQLSDIAVAQAEGGTWTRDGQTFLQITPAHVTNPDGAIHTYFEAYGVRPGTRYEVELRLTEADAAERIWRLEPDDLAFRLQFTSEMPGDIGRHHLRLDLSDTEPGEYVLAVRIQDADSQAYSLPSVTDVFVAKR